MAAIDIAAKDDHQATPPTHATSSACGMIEFLLNRGADVNIKSSHGMLSSTSLRYSS
jgi:hypothetical protein